MSKKKKSDASDSGVGTVLGAGAAVVAGAALIYGAKKLFDFLNGPSENEGAVGGDPRFRKDSGTTASASCSKKCNESSSDDDDDDNVRRRNRNHNEDDRHCHFPSPSIGNEDSRNHDHIPAASFSSVAQPRNSTEFAPPQVKSLTDQLNDYYLHYVSIRPQEYELAFNVVAQMKQLISMQLPIFLTDDIRQLLHTVELADVGSAADNLQVIRCEEFDIAILLKLDEGNWKMKPTEVASLWQIVKSCGNSEMCNEDGLLESSRIVVVLEEAIRNVLASTDDIPFTFEVQNINSTTIQLTVRYFDNMAAREWSLHINLVPTPVINGGYWLVPASSKISGANDREAVLCWRLCHYEDERHVIDHFLPLVVRTHRVILKIMKALRLNHPLTFGVLSSYHYKTVLMRILGDQSDASDWGDSALAERFIDFLMELGSCCKEKMLPNYFESDVNLLEDVSPDACRNISVLINRVLGRSDFASLLEATSYGTS